MSSAVTVRAHAKVNLSLRITGSRPDGCHELRTVFQALALHDTLTCVGRPGSLSLRSNARGLPLDESNLVWKAAAALWALLRRPSPPRDVSITIEKRIPLQSGLGGGSADAAATLLALARVWKTEVPLPALVSAAEGLGADVPFFLVGGAALGLGRGEVLYPLADLPRLHVVLVLPAFGVSTGEAYRWYDDAHADGNRPAVTAGDRRIPGSWPASAAEVVNDLEPPVIERHPEIAVVKAALMAAGAEAAAMSGSGSSVFGLFSSRSRAARAAADLRRRGWQGLLTRTVGHEEYGRLSRARVRRAPAVRSGRR